MNILIAYASKSGTTEKCAKKLAELLPNVTLLNLCDKSIDITTYDTVIIGSGIRMGMIHKKVRSFIEANVSQLNMKKTAFFICNGFYADAPTHIEKNFSQELRTRAICIESFGGELNINNLRGLDKFIAKMVTKSEKGSGKKPEILEDNIKAFADCILSSQIS